MSNIQIKNFFDISHYLLEFPKNGKTIRLITQMTGADLKLYIVLCHLGNRFSKEKFFHKDEELIMKTGLSRMSIHRSRKRLKEFGLLEDYIPGHSGKATVYILKIAKVM